LFGLCCEYEKNPLKNLQTSRQNQTSPSSFHHIKDVIFFNEFVTMYCASGILVLHIIDICSINGKYIIKNKNLKKGK
jgi:hypothetical protein